MAKALLNHIVILFATMAAWKCSTMPEILISFRFDEKGDLEVEFIAPHHNLATHQSYH